MGTAGVVEGGGGGEEADAESKADEEVDVVDAVSMADEEEDVVGGADGIGRWQMSSRSF